MFETILNQVTDENRAFVQQYLDYVDLKTDIIDTAYSLYMPQIRAEISELFDVVATHSKDKKTYNILEIGTKFGGTFYLWNSINRSGLNISIDLEAGIHGGVSKEEMDKRDLWFNERFDNCRFIRGNSHEKTTFQQVYSALHENYGHGLKYGDPLPDFPTFDFIFIDGDHTYEGVRQDFLDYSHLAKKGSIIVFHDITDSKRHRDRNVNVAQFWNEIKDDYEHYEIIHPDTDDVDQRWAGIGILVKK